MDYEFSLHRLPNELPVIHYSMGFEDLVMAPFADAPPIQGLSGHLSSHDFILSLETDADILKRPLAALMLRDRAIPSPMVGLNHRCRSVIAN